MARDAEARRPAEGSAPGEEAIRVLDLYETREKIYTRTLPGFYREVKKYTLLPLMLGYFLSPWLTIDGRQAIWFDLPNRKFHVLWATFWPQDFMLLAWLLIICAFALFTVTVAVGRVWCGFTCPQTVWTLWFLWAERLWEGDRNQRMRLDRAPWSLEKVVRKGGKWTTWLAIAFATGLTFVGYFAPIRQLVPDFFTLDAHPAAYFWIFFFTLMTFMNAGFLREQVCLYMCPYARFQSVMYDPDTLVVTYDFRRGEPRGPRRKGEDPRALGLGDCVDCTLCVQVCPTGIDIRDGLQYECINCGLCIDACNAVMDKMGYPRGLIRYTSERAIREGRTRLLRPRLLGYGVALAAMAGLFLWTLAHRLPLEVDVIRDRTLLYREAPDGAIENIYVLKIANKDRRPHRYRIAVEAPLPLELRGPARVEVAAGEVADFPLRLALAREQLEAPALRFRFRVAAEDAPDLAVSEESRFLGPAPGGGRP
ncbi:MAG: ferredoxin [Porticoccaceae bacterium]|nr:MAG: ferredoxin [Porticoccaceae bacterium]